MKVLRGSAGIDLILGFDDMHIEPVERDSKVTETGNGAEDDLDRETVHRSESSGHIIESSLLERPPKESKVSNNIDSGNVERSEAIVSSRSNVGEQGNVQAGDLDHEHGNKSDETVDRSAGIAGSDSNVGQPGNVEAADLDRTDDIDSDNVDSSGDFGGSRRSIVESINQRRLIDYTDSESPSSNEGTGGSVLRTRNMSAFGGGIVIAGGPSYVTGQTLYLAGDDVDSESFNRSDSTFGIIDTSSQVEIAPEVSNLSVGSRSFPAFEVSTASRRQITQEETATISDRCISVNSVQASPIEVSTLSRCSTSLTDTEVATASLSQEETATEASSTEVGHIREREISVSSLQTSSTSLPDTEVSTASRSEISQEGTVTEASSTEVGHIREREISVTSLPDTEVSAISHQSTQVRTIREIERSVTSLTDTEVSAISHQITQVRTIREIERSVTSVQTSSTEVLNASERDISVSVAQSSSAEVRNIRERENSVSSVQSNSTRVLIREREFSVSLVQASSTERENFQCL